MDGHKYWRGCAFDRAGDYSEKILGIARAHYGERIQFQQLDAQQVPFENGSFDVVILFEAIYYLPSAERFVAALDRLALERQARPTRTVCRDALESLEGPAQGRLL